MNNRIALYLGTSTLGIATFVLLLTSGCGPRGSSSEPTAVANKDTDSGFVGNAECARCHQKAFENHVHTRHARALKLVDLDSKDPRNPPVGPIRGTPYEVKRSGNGIDWVSEGDKSNSVDLAFGSGRTGVTFVHAVGPESAIELRMSYFPQLKRWSVTPGQEAAPSGEPGHLHEGAFARECVQCHAIDVPKDKLIPPDKLLGVGCESCHGPGKAHIAAMDRPGGGATGLANLAKEPASKLNALCAKCHTSKGAAAEVHSDEAARFPPIGLHESACYVRSNDTLSCIKCHDPHTDAATDPRSYERACLNCHGSGGNKSATKPANKPCPVNPRSGCIPCHMPKRKVMMAADVPTMMTDHFIHILVAGR